MGISEFIVIVSIDGRKQQLKSMVLSGTSLEIEEDDRSFTQLDSRKHVIAF